MEAMKSEELRSTKIDILERTVQYSLRIVKLYRELDNRVGRVRLILLPKCPSHIKKLVSLLTGSA